MPRMPADRDVMRAPKGMLDVLPPDSARWIELVGRFAGRAERFGYGLVLTPIVEHYEVFARVGEIIELLWGFCRDLGLRKVRLLVNSMGDAETRERYRAVLLDYWRAHSQLLGSEMERAQANPLRILDSKRADWSDMLERAPQLG